MCRERNRESSGLSLSYAARDTLFFSACLAYISGSR